MKKITVYIKPFSTCIPKAKAGKPYQFGNKIGIMASRKSLIITAVEAFKDNPNNSKTIESLLEQSEKNVDFLPQVVYDDRGGRVTLPTQIQTPYCINLF